MQDFVCSSETPLTTKISFGLFRDIRAIGLYLFDVGSDIAVGAVYINEGETWWGGLTLAFAVVALVVTNVISCVDYDKIESPWRKVFWVFTILQLGMIFLLLYKLREQVKENSTDNDIKTGIHFTRLLEAFLESAPQVVLQMYIMTHLTGIKWITGVSVVFSLISLIWVTRSWYMDDDGLSLEDVDGKYKWLLDHACLLVWLLLTIPPTVIYWVVNIIEICMLNYQHDNDWEWFVDLLTSLVYSFPSMFTTSLFAIFAKSRDGFSFIWMCVALIAQFIANTVMFTPCFAASGYATWYGIPAAVVIYYGYIVGIMFCGMLFYFDVTIKHMDITIQLKARCHVPDTMVPEELSVVA
ncbi:XK-related protein 6-like [Amphiura filiformis]|uniref:XK-related protein 6-like n=1 Tax=Amphiura filiformis TaxID=82378 RepID=UPI003B22613E